MPPKVRKERRMKKKKTERKRKEREQQEKKHEDDSFNLIKCNEPRTRDVLQKERKRKRKKTWKPQDIEITMADDKTMRIFLEEGNIAISRRSQ